MKYLLSLDTLERIDSQIWGGKAASLAKLRAAGLPTPESYGLPVDVYREFLAATRLEDFISFELGRKDFTEMRWEEIWDLSLRVRRHFMSVAWPEKLYQALSKDLTGVLDRWKAVAVRSTAPGEDAWRQSFAGLHDSRVMVQGADGVLSAIRAVWASLWSNRALLYRRELALDPHSSAMAVLVQEMVIGNCSGVLFTRSPRDASRMIIEAVWGLNQALVDGTLEPERWELMRDSGQVVAHNPRDHHFALQPTSAGLDLCPLPANRAGRSPLDDGLLDKLYQLGRKVEGLLGQPADIEWTVQRGRITLLQARPITTSAAEDDQRRWYIGLHRSLPALESLQLELEQEILPGMLTTAECFAAVDLAGLTDADLVDELNERYRQTETWEQAYRDKCIPMSHGVRLFGEYYNDLVKPDDPYAFVDLLRSDTLIAVVRNRRLLELADELRAVPGLLQRVKDTRQLPTDGPFADLCRDFINAFGEIDWVSSAGMSLTDWLVRLAEAPAKSVASCAATKPLKETFLACCSPEQRLVATRILAVARASYALRDNDNLHIGRVRAQLHAAEAEVRRRLSATEPSEVLRGVLRAKSPAEIIAAHIVTESANERTTGQVSTRQLVGQPAVMGLVRGIARVLRRGADLRDFQAGEVLVCDAIEPNMTFLVPLAVAIVERRGGMLIHGAIIAREYGLPCVTGAPAATTVIRSGDVLTVDGYLGIVTIDRSAG